MINIHLHIHLLPGYICYQVTNKVDMCISLENKTLENKIIEKVDRFKYLRHEIRKNKGNQIDELQRRIGLGWTAYGTLRDAYKSI